MTRPPRTVLPRSRLLLAALSLSVVPVGGACGRGSPAAASAPAPEVAARALCLAAPPAKDALADDVRAHVARLSASRSAQQSGAHSADAWVALGLAWVKLARNSGDAGYYLHADGCVEEALARKPHYAPALDLRALVLLNGHRFAEARDLARDMIARDPEDMIALATLADALLELGDLAGAEHATQQMMDLKPSLPSYARASHLLWLRGDTDGALRAIRSAYDAGRGQKDKEPVAWVLTEAAHVFRMKGDLAGAARGYDMALEHKPDFAPALVGRARVALAHGESAAAIEMLERALALQPLVESAWLLAHAHRAQGADVQAEQALVRAIAIGRQSDARSLALVLASERRDLAAAQQAIARDADARGGIYGDDVQALIAHRLGHTEQANALITRALAHGTPDPRLHVHAALIRNDPAAMTRALESGGAHDPTLVALARELLPEVK